MLSLIETNFCFLFYETAKYTCLLTHTPITHTHILLTLTPPELILGKLNTTHTQKHVNDCRGFYY